MATKADSLADQLFPTSAPEDDLSILDIPPNKRRLLTETYDFAISTIISHLEEKTIAIPEFQRKYVWNRGQASRLIESLIIQCPIPVIYLNQERDETLSVIDGNQRIRSIELYLKNEFALQNLTAYPELEGLYFSDLDPRFQRHIKNRTLRCITILKETHPQIKFDVFERINTGAVQLNPQEVRHGVYHGTLMDLLDELVENKTWKKLTGFKKDIRMKSAELILRFISLNLEFENYKKPLKNFLNQFCENYSNICDETYDSWRFNFSRTVSAIDELFSNKAFRILNDDLETTSNTINAALCDSLMIAFNRLDITKDKVSQWNKTNVLSSYQKLINSDRFKATVTSGTSAESSVKYRINETINFFEGI